MEDRLFLYMLVAFLLEASLVRDGLLLDAANVWDGLLDASIVGDGLLLDASSVWDGLSLVLLFWGTAIFLMLLSC